MLPSELATRDFGPAIAADFAFRSVAANLKSEGIGNTEAPGNRRGLFVRLVCLALSGAGAMEFVEFSFRRGISGR